MGDEGAIDQYIQWLAGHGVELDNRAVGQLQQVLDGQLGSAQFNSDLNGDVQNHVEFVHHRTLAGVSAKGLENLGR